MNRTWQRGFEAAKAASLNSIAPRTARRVGAALFAGPILLSFGFNSYGQSHPDAQNSYSNVHAEHRALLRRRYYKDSGLVMYVYREIWDGSAACSQPCINCINLMKIAGVRAVRFTNQQGIAEEIKF